MTRSGAPAMRTAAPCLLVLTAALVSSSVGLVFNCSFPACDCMNSSGHVEIPSNYTSIQANLFYWSTLCGNFSYLIQSVSMTSVTEIGDYAFAQPYRYPYLESVDLGDAIQSIGEKAFLYTGISSIVIPPSVTEMGNDAFYTNESLRSWDIRSNMTINSNTFGNCNCSVCPQGAYTERINKVQDCVQVVNAPYPWITQIARTHIVTKQCNTDVNTTKVASWRSLYHEFGTEPRIIDIVNPTEARVCYFNESVPADGSANHQYVYSASWTKECALPPTAVVTRAPNPFSSSAPTPAPTHQSSDCSTPLSAQTGPVNINCTNLTISHTLTSAVGDSVNGSLLCQTFHTPAGPCVSVDPAVPASESDTAPYWIGCDQPIFPANGAMCQCLSTTLPVGFVGFGWIFGGDDTEYTTCRDTCTTPLQCVGGYTVSHLGYFSQNISADAVFLNYIFCNGSWHNPPVSCPDFANRKCAEFKFVFNDYGSRKQCAYRTVNSTSALISPDCHFAGCDEGGEWYNISQHPSITRSKMVATIQMNHAVVPASIASQVNQRAARAIGEFAICECTAPIDAMQYFGGDMYVELVTPNNSNVVKLMDIVNISAGVTNSSDYQITCDGDQCRVISASFNVQPREWYPDDDAHVQTHPFVWMGSTIQGPIGAEYDGNHIANVEALKYDYNVRLPNTTMCMQKPNCTVKPSVVGDGTCQWGCFDLDIPVLFSTNFSNYAPPRIRRYNYTTVAQCKTPEVPAARALAFVNTAWLPFLFNIPGNTRLFVPWRDATVVSLQQYAHLAQLPVVPSYGCGGVINAERIPRLVPHTRSTFIASITEQLEQLPPDVQSYFQTEIENVVDEHLRLYPEIIVSHPADLGVYLTPRSRTMEFSEWLELSYTMALFGMYQPFVHVTSNYSVSFELDLITPAPLLMSWESCDRNYCTSRVHHAACAQIPASDNCSTIPLCEPCVNAISSTTTLGIPTITFPPTPVPADPSAHTKLHEVGVVAAAFVVFIAFIMLVVAARVLYTRGPTGEETVPLIP